ncbi:hypothetical protein EIC84_20345 [Comamonas sp. A23]|nr:hypothetical protein EIC84_20345 [Comamonas sp. A23]
MQAWPEAGDAEEGPPRTEGVVPLWGAPCNGKARSDSGGNPYQFMTKPPLTGRTWPVTKRAPSDSR